MLRIATDVNVSAALQPRPDIGTLCPDPILHIDFLCLVARKGQVESRKPPLFEVPLPLKLVQKIAGKISVAEEQPVVTGCTAFVALFNERAKRRDARAGANHDDVGVVVGWQVKARVRLNEYGHLAARFQPVRQVRGCSTPVLATECGVTHRCHSEMHFVRVCTLAGGDRIGPRA